MRLVVILLLASLASARIHPHKKHNTFIIERDDEIKRYEPDWSDLDNRPLPEWYDKAKIGIFLHWGVYSVPSYESEWFWNYWKNGHNGIVNFMAQNYPPGFSYQDFAPMFAAEFFDARQWADFFVKTGAKYVVLTTKHHEGFTLFPSSRSFGWNAMDVGPHRDLVKELAEAIKSTGIKFGAYHSLFEWFNPMFLEDQSNHFSTRVFPDFKVWPDLKQIITDYKPSLLWSDGDVGPDTYWNSTDLLAWLYNDSPVRDEIVVNDRWGDGTHCTHGGYFNCDDRYNPGTLQPHKWENAFTIDKKSWGYRRNMNISDLLTMKELLKEIAVTVSCGGNALINIGPTKEGTIAPIFQEKLLALGKWLEINGEAIYESSPWIRQNDSLVGSDVWYTCRKTKYNAALPTAKPNRADKITAIYAIMLNWPQNNVLKVRYLAPVLKTNSRLTLLGYTEDIKWSTINGVVSITLPNPVNSFDAWVLKIIST